MSNYNFAPLPLALYEFDTFRIFENTSIDIFQLGINNERRGKDKQHYIITLLENDNPISNVAVGFYNSKEPSAPIIIEGSGQQVVSNYYTEDGINYFVVVIANQGNTIEFYRTSYNKLFFINLS